MNIKVSGVTELKQLQQLDGIEIDFAALYFGDSFANAANGKIEKKELKKADFDLKKTAILSNPSLSDALDIIDEYGVEVVELAGDASPEICDDLSTEVEVIKAFTVDSNTDVDALIADYDAVCDFYHFQLADATALETVLKAKIEKPFFVGGNISLEEALALKKCKHPDFFGVNLEKQIIAEDGAIDFKKLLGFLQALK